MPASRDHALTYTFNSYSLREHLHCKIIKCIVENYFILGSRPEPIMLALFRIIGYKFGKNNAGIIGSLQA